MSTFNSTQLELFSQGTESRARAEGRTSLFTYLKGHEKVIIMSIAFLVTGVVAFCLGVERGKRLGQILMPQQRYDMAVKQKAVPAQVKQIPVPVAVVPAPPLTQRVQPIVPPQKAVPATGHYTVQLASFSSPTTAQKEAEVLKKRGYAPVLAEKGKFVILCVGAFPSKAKAETLLAKLQSEYRGCYIRRL